MTRPLTEEDFWAKVEKTDTCWLWQGGLKDGYGRVMWRGQRLVAHRVSYLLLKGPIADGLVVDHLCRVRQCVNPDHLEAVTMIENVMRGESPHARHARKTHCDNGHEFTPENTYTMGGSRRQCRTCNREAVAAYKARRVA